MKHEELNERLRNFLVKSREKAGLSQADVAARSEIFELGRTLDQRAVSRIESQPIHADAIKIAGYLSAVGIQPSKYYELLSEYTYQKDESYVSTINADVVREKIGSARALISKVKSSIEQYNHEYIDTIGLTAKVEQLGKLVDGLDRKPVIGCFGNFDAGKSTLINTVIDDSLLPVSYQPATCVVNLLMHESDRPESITGNVAVFKKGFRPHLIHSRSEVAKYLIEQGDEGILSRLGVHNYDSESSHDAYIAIVFSSADILRSVWLLDTPGDLNSSDESDTEKALGGVELSDGIVFVSPHTGFFKASDLGFASNVLRQSPPVDRATPLEHLLFIQSHCHSEIGRGEIDAVGNVVFNRVKKQLDELVFSSWVEDGYISCLPKASDLTQRVQPFWRENVDYRGNTLRRISELATYLSEKQLATVEKHIERTFKSIENLLLEEVAKLKNRKFSADERIREVKEKDARFRSLSDQLIEDFNALIGSCDRIKQNDLEVMKLYFKHITSIEGLEELITETYSDKKEAESELGSYVSQLLSTKLEKTLKASGKSLARDLDTLLDRWQDAAPVVSSVDVDADIPRIKDSFSSFDSRSAFIGGFAGLGSLGAMALYVSTIASNLGAYILVGKAAGVLVSLGLVGSVTTVTSFVAAIGGPITIGIVFAAAIGYLIYRLAGGSWQKSLAKKASEALRKEPIFENIEDVIDNYWDSTATALKAGLDELIAKTNEHVENLTEDAAVKYDAGKIDQSVSLIDETLLIARDYSDLK